MLQISERCFDFTYHNYCIIVLTKLLQVYISSTIPAKPEDIEQNVLSSFCGELQQIIQKHPCDVAHFHLTNSHEKSKQLTLLVFLPFNTWGSHPLAGAIAATCFDSHVLKFLGLTLTCFLAPSVDAAW